MAVAEILRELTNDDRAHGLVDLRPGYFALLNRADDAQITSWAEDSDELMLAMRDALAADPITLDPAEREEEWDAEGIDLVADLQGSLGVEDNGDPVALARHWLAELKDCGFLAERSTQVIPVLNAEIEKLGHNFALDQDPAMLSVAFCSLLRQPTGLKSMMAALSIFLDEQGKSQFDAMLRSMATATN